MTVIAWRDPLRTAHKYPLPSDQTAKVLLRRQDYCSARRTCIHNRVPGARLVLAAVTDTGKAPSADMRRERCRRTPPAQGATPAVERSHCGALPCKSRPLYCAHCAVLSVTTVLLRARSCVSGIADPRNRRGAGGSPRPSPYYDSTMIDYEYIDSP